MHVKLPKIFLDGADPEETGKAELLLKEGGFTGLDGQTTNPSLVIKYLHRTEGTISERIKIAEYHRIVRLMAGSISGPISIQVIANVETTKEEILSQAYDRITWIPNAVVKIPCTPFGIAASEILCREMPLNMTYVFTEDQAASIYAATLHATHPVYISPFVGKQEDNGFNGMDIVKNILEMYENKGDGHVQVLVASTRTIDHILYAIKLKTQAITIPFSLLKTWKEENFRIPDSSYEYPVLEKQHIPYKALSLKKSWKEYDITSDLTVKTMHAAFEDWMSVVS